MFVGGELGISRDIPGHADYIAFWIENLRRDKREIFRAAADAQRIADYLLAFHPDYARAAATARDSFEDDAAAGAPSDTAQAA